MFAGNSTDFSDYVKVFFNRILRIYLNYVVINWKASSHYAITAHYYIQWPIKRLGQYLELADFES